MGRVYGTFKFTTTISVRWTISPEVLGSLVYALEAFSPSLGLPALFTFSMESASTDCVGSTCSLCFQKIITFYLLFGVRDINDTQRTVIGVGALLLYGFWDLNSGHLAYMLSHLGRLLHMLLEYISDTFLGPSWQRSFMFMLIYRSPDTSTPETGFQGLHAWLDDTPGILG